MAALPIREDVEPEPPPDTAWEAPPHGFGGDRAETPLASVPAALTIAVSREAGSRGATLARRIGKKLGWQVYTQELLDYITQEGNFRDDIVSGLPTAAAAWVEQRLEQLLREQNLSQHPAVLDVARIILSLGAQGEVVLVGRGAGCILPADSTLHVRVFAPVSDRIAYMSQWLRLTVEQAAELVHARDRRRAEYLATHFHRQPNDVYQYDVLLNSSLLGEELCAELIVHAARAKLAAWRHTDKHRPEKPFLSPP